MASSSQSGGLIAETEDIEISEVGVGTSSLHSGPGAFAKAHILQSPPPLMLKPEVFEYLARFYGSERWSTHISRLVGL